MSKYQKLIDRYKKNREDCSCHCSQVILNPPLVRCPLGLGWGEYQYADLPCSYDYQFLPLQANEHSSRSNNCSCKSSKDSSRSNNCSCKSSKDSCHCKKKFCNCNIAPVADWKTVRTRSNKCHYEWLGTECIEIELLLVLEKEKVTMKLGGCICYFIVPYPTSRTIHVLVRVTRECGCDYLQPIKLKSC